MNFMTALKDAWRRNESLVCVGLDPEPGRLPAGLSGTEGIFEFCRDIVDATAGSVCAFKPQIAHFAAQRAEDVLERLIRHIHDRHPGIPVILDAKRGDIGSTAKHYAMEAFERYDADAVTLNPYLGHDSVAPFLERADKGVILLCRTSNPGGKDFQALDCGGEPLYIRVAQTIAREWNGNGNCALVTGATWPEELGRVRREVGDMPLLVPGIGAQGGDVEAVVREGRTADGTGLMISSSRAILYAGSGSDFADVAHRAAEEMRKSVNSFLS
ncbi:orotidine-5'-phosphate decarboxylase [Luteibacter sp. UNC138MFCol5.1]|uniref:orotidine-5'-phosphate decarboxylase n=1 Tax=Luteibacter sp. UNC138MFCol5.1 TaxID=1502774 RepID=UPI0008D4AEBC|nr:orotidine-5'-phosphate decarboxylase [Luteibacter sp. UNC138MFCol5.1]SEP05124.1 orotidine-5'-phosphate decarboxylase [Luteibacter sp. UNC138MFCol5.1]